MATRTKERAEAAAKPAADGKPPIPAEKLKQMYALMVQCRTMEARISNLFKQGRFAGNYYPALGQEATAVGCAVDLLPGDTIAPSHRDFIANLVKGTPLDLMFAHLFARKAGPDQGRSSPAHCGYAPLNIITPASTIAAQLNIGTGVALAKKMQKKNDIVMAFSGDGSTSLGFWHEAVNFAGVHQLPIVYVVQNNGWAESVPTRQQCIVEDLSEKARGYGMPGITVDGNDVVAVYRVATEAIDRARRGGGPTLIECKTYRWTGHSEIDPAKYRDPEELERWKQKDPIPHMERYLAQFGLWNDSMKQQIAEEFSKRMDAAIEFAEKSPFAEPEEALDHLYSFSIRERALVTNMKTWTPFTQSK